MPSGNVWARSRLAFTAAASIGVPSWNVASSRSVSVSVVPSSENSHDSASIGATDWSVLMIVKRSYSRFV